MRLILTLFCIAVCLFAPQAKAQYSGGSGTPEDPYQIATAADLIFLGETPEDYNKHFILTADIDLDPNLPGGRVFDRAVVAPDANDIKHGFQGDAFSGVFDGKDHKISHITMVGENYLGLFGQLGYQAVVANLGLEAVDVNGILTVGAIVGQNKAGSILNCSSTGTASGESDVGGLVGLNGEVLPAVGHNSGNIVACYSTCTVKRNAGSVAGLAGNNTGSIASSYGTGSVGGLAGRNTGSIISSYSTGPVVSTGSHAGGLVGTNWGRIAASYSTGSVGGGSYVGGLVGNNGIRNIFKAPGREGWIHNSYSTGMVTGDEHVGGLVGCISKGHIAATYSTGKVVGTGDYVGGLVGVGDASVNLNFWDMEASGQVTSGGGTGKTTAEMQTVDTFRNAGWDSAAGEFDGTCDYWRVVPGEYPQLNWQSSGIQAMPEGLGTAEHPYLVRDARDLGTMWLEPQSHYCLTQSIDLSGMSWSMAVIPWFGGSFDGNHYIISNLRIQGDHCQALFGTLFGGSEVLNLGLEAVDVNGTGNVGGLAMCNHGNISSSHSTGIVSGETAVGGLIGDNTGGITASYSTCSISGESAIGGLVGNNKGSITVSYSTGSISGESAIGGLVGNNKGSITVSYSACTINGESAVGGLVGLHANSHDDMIANCYSTGMVSGDYETGGLVGRDSGGNPYSASIIKSYSTATVIGNESTGGLVGYSENAGIVILCFWDIQTSGLTRSDGGRGVTSTEMQAASTFNDWASCEPIWTIDDGHDYPRLYWENKPGDIIKPTYLAGFLSGYGTNDSPYLIYTAEDLNLVGSGSCDWDKHFKLMADIDLSGFLYDGAVIARNLNDNTERSSYFQGTDFTGVFDGNGHTISHLTIKGAYHVGLFGQLASGGAVSNLSLGAVDVNGVGYIGSIVGCNNGGSITNCSNTGTLSGDSRLGGLVGSNNGSIANCRSTGTISGDYSTGGLVGSNSGSIAASYSNAVVSGDYNVGGLVGANLYGTIAASCSTGEVEGVRHVGGLVGDNRRIITESCSTGAVSGDQSVGGLVGRSRGYYPWEAVVTDSYSAGKVAGRDKVGGLVGEIWDHVSSSYSTGQVTGNTFVGGLAGHIQGGHIVTSFWDVETSNLSTSVGGTGRTTMRMQTVGTFLNAGWDFIGETENGTDDIWWIDEGQDYPRLWWELIAVN